MARVALTESLDQIRRCMEERRYDDGAAIARVVLDAYPDCVQAQRMLGEALLENGLLPEARTAFEAVLETDPEDFVSYAGLGLIAERCDSLDEAVLDLQRAAELAPNSEEVRGELLRLHQKAGQADTGKLKISRAALARIYARSEMPARALAEFGAVLDDEPDRLDVRLGLAEALWREGQSLEAKAQAETVLEYLPRCVKASLILASALRAEGLDQHAQGYLEQAAAIDPLGEYAQRLFGTASPITATDPSLEVPAYLLGAEAPSATKEGIDLELPDWLLEQDAEPAEAEAEEAPPEAESAPAEAPEPVRSADTEDQGDAWLDSLPPLERPAAEGMDAEAVEAALAEAHAAYGEREVQAALAIYGSLVASEAGLDEVIAALTEIVADSDSVEAVELLGDALVCAGRHREALDAYRRVLGQLEA